MKTEGLESLLSSSASVRPTYLSRDSGPDVSGSVLLAFNGDGELRDKALSAVEDLQRSNTRPHQQGFEMTIAAQMKGEMPDDLGRARDYLEDVGFPTWLASWCKFRTPSGELPWEKIWIELENLSLETDQDRMCMRLMAERISDPAFRKEIKNSGRKEMERILEDSITALKEGDPELIVAAFVKAQDFKEKTKVLGREWMMEVLMQHLETNRQMRDRQEFLINNFQSFLGRTTDEQSKLESEYLDGAYKALVTNG